jgi:hypothetical protein
MKNAFNFISATFLGRPAFGKSLNKKKIFIFLLAVLLFIILKKDFMLIFSEHQCCKLTGI